MIRTEAALHSAWLGTNREKFKRVHLSDFNYGLPPDLIAQQPLADRSASRLLVLDRSAQTFEDRRFAGLPELLQPGDLLVLNNTRVFPARLLGRRRGARAQPIGRGNPAAGEYLTGEVELLLTRRESEDVWQGLVHPGRKIRTGEVLVFGDGELEAEVLGHGERGLRRVRLIPQRGRPAVTAVPGEPASALSTGPEIDRLIDRLGHVPLPPYIHRRDQPQDRETYQTVYARVRGAVAAPTAGLHFTPQILRHLAARGVETAEITLHVGPGTFRPVQVEHVEDHRMEPEAFEISEVAAARINKALSARRRIIAVGTTCVRTLEHGARVFASGEGQADARGARIEPGRGETDLFIYPGFAFRVINGLLTNFHLPRSTLLMLVSAFAGREFVLRAYEHAVGQRYRFYSYGDCMLVL
ncbi:MAG TPA: tRNA preQ1(34) S-adenosylmethionine ribosyltransferase-isomerase QueA [Terriglobia bacterium]|nr:tRNA preQ1(34) S-adenosylmethionine ribosyltransferase-isomerase QueA [Terriglobia bacterium]